MVAHVPIIPALRRLRQEDFHEFESYQDYKVKPISKTQNYGFVKTNILQSLKRAMFQILTKHLLFTLC